MFKSITDFISALWIKPRDIFRSIKNGETKKIFREHILRVQDSNLKIATAIGFGIFMSIFPIWGFQTVVAIFIAAFFRLNKAIVIVAVNISIPPIIPIFLYISFLIGGFLLKQSTNITFGMQFDPSIDGENIQNDLFQYYLGAVVFAILSGFLIGLISYFLLLIFRKEMIPENKS